MDDSNRRFSDLVGALKSWMPWGSEPAHVSRDFWMPDESCRVCYECDSQFTWFNRRHHCRHCGRIFCPRCTSNWVPTPSTEFATPHEIRVCNFCFKQCQQGLAAHLKRNEVRINGTELAGSYLSHNSSMSNLTFVTVPEANPGQLQIMDTNLEVQSIEGTVNNNRLDYGEGNQPRGRFQFGSNRSEDGDEEFRASRFGSTTSYFSQISGYFSHSKFDDMEREYNSFKVHPSRDALDLTSINGYSSRNSFESHTPGEVEQVIQKEGEHYISDDCEAPSLCASEDLVTEPVDFENDRGLWLPPEAEDEEDEKEALLFEDEDDGNAAGELGYLRDSSSFESGEYKSKDKSNEERKKAMKDVVDDHFRAVITRLLQVENLSELENDKEGWLEIITGLSWEASLLLKPDMTRGGQMDPGGYVKVKCLASGLRSQSVVVKGVVCKKNVAHRRMTSKFEKPRLLILGGALEYHRVSSALSSFDTLLQQEMDHLKMAVAKIDSHHPDILLVEKSVSRHAQEYLLAKNISLVLNIKRPLLERISRCTDGQIVPSIDHLSSQKLGYCDFFHVEKVSEEHVTAFQAGKKQAKTLMYFEGCPMPLGCTILLRGANENELKKVKHVVQYGVFAAYQFALETSFLADEGASLPELPLYAPITVALPDKTKIGRSISTIPDFSIRDSEETPGPQNVSEPPRSNSVPTSELLRLAIASIHGNEQAETSYPPTPMSFQYTNMPASCSEKGSQYPFSRHASEAKGLADLDLSSESNNHCGVTQSGCLESDAGNSVRNPISVQITGEQTVEEQPALKEEFQPSPSDHQSILVSLSSRCVWKGTVCERSQLFRIKYYGNFDKPLGRFLRDHLFDQSYRCRSCDMPAEAHVECYTHRQGTLIISVKKLPEIILPGEKNGKIWMWHRCLKCPRVNGFPPATRRVVMSDAAWGLSFGKFLELSFSSHAAASRLANCGHSLHRDCLRFYGFGKMVVCFRYASIDVHSVYLPPHKLDFNYERQDWVEQELNEVASQAELLFAEVITVLHLLVERKSYSSLINNGVKVPESRRHLADLEGMLQREKSEFEEALQKISNKEPKKGEPQIDILDLNRLRRQLVFQSYMWDHRLIYADSLDNNSQPVNMKDTSAESIQKPLADTGKPLDIPVPIKISKVLDSSSSGSGSTHTKPEKIPEHPEPLLNQRTDAFSYSDPENQTPTSISIGKDTTDESNAAKSNPTHPKALSEEKIARCLSETLDAAWHGPIKSNDNNNNDNNNKDNNISLSAKLDLEDHREDQSALFRTLPFLYSKGSENMEETVRWLGMPFISVYRSLNKNFLGSAQKLDTLGEYDPVYISSFRESEIRGGARWLLTVGLNDTVIPLYDDEPTSIISYALLSPDYLTQLSDEVEKSKDISDSIFSLQTVDSGNFQSFHSLDEAVLDFGPGDENMLYSTSARNSLSLDPLSYTKALHARVCIADDGPHGKVRYTVTCYYAKRFEALRRICCPSEVDFARSLSRCKKWGAKGGKSNVFFAKTLDERFIIKQVTKTELESFIKFAPEYFKYLSQSIGTRSPTCLAKIFGIYQVTSKHLKGGKEIKMDLLVMENLLFRRKNITRLYDLKGSSRSRYNPDSSGSNPVLLDQNLIEAMPTSPIFVGNKAKKMLERAVWNDTAFLASIDVMDYSLLVGVDEETHELVIGIIDFMRQYTWDKHLETWVKASGILGGPKNAMPTVISPKQYKMRFRKAMTTYFLMVPDQWWSPPMIVPSKSQTDSSEENNTQGTPLTEVNPS